MVSPALLRVLTVQENGAGGFDVRQDARLQTAFDSVTGQRIFYGNVVNQLNSTQTFLNQEIAACILIPATLAQLMISALKARMIARLQPGE